MPGSPWGSPESSIRSKKAEPRVLLLLLRPSEQRAPARLQRRPARTSAAAERTCRVWPTAVLPAHAITAFHTIQRPSPVELVTAFPLLEIRPRIERAVIPSARHLPAPLRQAAMPATAAEDRLNRCQHPVPRATLTAPRPQTHSTTASIRESTTSMSMGNILPESNCHDTTKLATVHFNDLNNHSHDPGSGHAGEPDPELIWRLVHSSASRQRELITTDCQCLGRLPKGSGPFLV